MTTAGQAVQVVRTIPADMAADVQSSTPLTVEFGGALSQAFYQTINLNLFRNGQSIDGELFYNPAARQVMFKPKTPLQTGQMYTAQLSFGDGSGGTAEKMWNFRVVGAGNGRSAAAAGGMSDAMQAAGSAGIAVPNVAAAASVKLAITNANMAGGTLNPQNPLEVSFSEALDITSLKDAPVKLLCNRETVGVDYRLSRDLKTLTLVPRQPLRPGNEYGVAISQTLSGSSGARLPKNTVIPFRVGGSSAADYEVPANVLEEAPADAAAPVSAPARRQGLINSGSFDAPAPDAFVAAPVQDVAPLKLVGMSPQNGSVVTNLSQPITIAFSQDVRPETLNEFTFRVEDEFGPVPAKIQYLSGQKRAMLTPVGVLDANRSYRVIITQGITDLSGRPLHAGFASTFATTSPAAAPAMPEAFAAAPRQTRPPARQAVVKEPVQESRELEVLDDEAGATGAAADGAMEADADWNAPAPRQAAPTARRAAPRETLSTFKVTGILPAANAEQVARNSKIFIHFNEPASTNTVNPINISVFGHQERVEGRVSYDARRNRAIFIPAAPLEAETQYKVLISDKIKSQAGEQLAARYSWQFTTQSERQSRTTAIRKPRAAEADAAFYIPLADGRTVMPAAAAARLSQPATPASTGFVYVPAGHWTFKSLKRVISKGLLPGMPFYDVSKVTRYEFASAVRSALDNLRGMSTSQKKPTLRVGDLVELEQLVIAFRGELRSFGVDVSWFERFLAAQGVSIADVERRVGLNGQPRQG